MNTAHGTVPEYGAIFISNSVTRRECFERKIFGLPYWQTDFVLQIKPGMILFLFEYEKRLLHGVFRAVSDGAMNIVPHAYSSTGQQYPAQVKFSILWCCNPLSENQFRNAIEENYFSPKKFNFGLSKKQVHSLLSTFSLTKFSDQLHPRQLSGDSLECSRDHLIDESQSVADVHGKILNEGLQGKVMEVEDQANTMQKSTTMPHYNINIIPPPESSTHHSPVHNRNFTSSSVSQSNAQIMWSSLQSQSDCMTGMPFQTSTCLETVTVPSVSQSQILNEGLQGKLMEGEDQVNPMQESATLHHCIRSIIPPSENSTHCSLMDSRNFTCNSGSQSNAQIMRPSLQSQSDCMTSMPFQTISKIDVSCSDPNLHSLPTQECEDEGSSGISTGDNPFHVLKDSLSPYQSELVLERQESIEADCSYVPKAKEFPIQLPPDSVNCLQIVSSMPSIEQTAAYDGLESHDNFEGMHSDRERKASVFSRLTYPSDASIQEFNDYADYEKLFLDSSVDEVMSLLERHHWQWEEANHKVLSQEHNIGRNFMKKKWKMFSSSSYSNSIQVSDELGTNIENNIDDNSNNIDDKVLSQEHNIGWNFMKKKWKKSSSSSYSNSIQVSDELGTNIENNIDDNSNHIAIDIPFVNFKRRRKPFKVENNASTGAKNVNVESVQLSGVQQKRRKLIRPSYTYVLRGSVDANNFSPSLRDTPKDGLQERANSDHIIEMGKMEKLCQADVFPDIIWLVDDEKNDIGSETEANVEDCFVSTIKGSEDRMVSSNYITNLHITSKDLGVKESCSSNFKCLTIEDHVLSQNLNNSGLCSRQELTLEEGSEPNAGSNVIKVNQGSNQSNEKEIAASMQMVDEPYRGGAVAVMTESIDKSSSPLDSAPPSVHEESIERRKQDNEISMQIVDEPYQCCTVAIMTESLDKSSCPLDSAPQSVVEEANERRKQDNEISMHIFDEPYQDCTVAVMTESSDKSSSSLDLAPQSFHEEAIEGRKQDNEMSMQMVDESYHDCTVAGSDKSSSPLD